MYSLLTSLTRRNLLALSLIATSFVAFAQPAGIAPNLPPAPEAAGLGEVIEVPIGEYTGSFNYPIPLKTLSYRGASVPISLGYQSGGIRVAEESSWVGLGWNLNAGGVITRSIRGGDDFGGGGSSFDDAFVGYLSLIGDNRIPDGPTSTIWEYANNEQTISVTVCNPRDDCYFEDDGSNVTQDYDDLLCPVGTKDLESDLYSFNFAGMSGKFSINRDGSFQIQDAQDIQIELCQSDNNEHEWSMTNNQGITYYFGTVTESRQYTWSKSVTYSLNENGAWNYNEPGLWANDWTKYVSAWYLTRIELPFNNPATGERWIAAEFDYNSSFGANGRVKPIPTFSEDHSERLICTWDDSALPDGCSSSPITGPQSSGTRSVNVMEYDNIYLDEITTPFERVVFHSDSSRSDLTNGRKLKRLEYFTTKGGVETKTGETLLTHSITSATVTPDFGNEPTQWDKLMQNSTTVNEYIDATNVVDRLRLETVETVGSGGESSGVYSFVYDTEELPAKTSFAVDAWGFFNGKTSNTTYLPKYEAYGVEIGGYVRDIILPGADKSVDDAFAGAHQLTEVSSPLGAKTTFDFEGNDYFLDDYVVDPYRSSRQLGIQMSGNCTTSLASLNTTPSFTIDNGHPAMPVNLKAEFDWARFADCGAVLGGQCGLNNECLDNVSIIVELISAANGQVVDSWDSRVTANTIDGGGDDIVMYQGAEYGDVPDGDYLLRTRVNYVNAATDDELLPQDFLYMGVKLSWSTYEYIGNQKSGGLRVKSVNYNPGDGQSINYSYAYKDDNDNSTGIPANLPRNIFNDNETSLIYFDCYGEGGPDAGGGLELYFPITLNCEGISRSSQSYLPLSTAHFGQFTGYSRVTKLHGETGENGQTVSTFFNRSVDINFGGRYGEYLFESGTPGFRTQRNGRPETQSQFSNTGTLLQETEYNYSSNPKINPGEWFFRVLPPGGFSVSYVQTNNNPPPLQSSACGYVAPMLVAYRDVPEWNQLLSTTTRTYDQNGQSFVETVQSSTYNQDNFNLLTQTITGPGGSKTTSYKYAEDFNSNLYQSLVAARMTGIPVQTSHPNGSTYKTFFNNTWLTPRKVRETFSDGTFIEAAILKSFHPTHGLPRKVDIHGLDANETYVWSADQLLESKTFKNHTNTYTYSPERLVQTITDIDGQQVTYGYDGLQRLKTINARGGAVQTNINYSIGGGNNSVSKTTTFTQGDPLIEFSAFDGMGRPTYSTLNGIEQSRNVYDKYGRVSEQLYMPSYGMTTLQYEASPLNRVLVTNHPGAGSINHSYSTYKDGTIDFTMVETTDEEGNTSKVVTDVFGRTVRQIDALGGNTTYEYTNFDAPTIIQPPLGDPYTYVYNPYGRTLASKTIPNGGTTSYTYDSANRLKTTALPSGLHTIYAAYDDYGREVATTSTAPTAGGDTYTLDDFDPSALLTKTVFSNTGPLLERGKPSSTETAFLLPDGNVSPNRIVTTYTYNSSDYGRVSSQSEAYTLDGEPYTDDHTFTYDDRDLVLNAAVDHDGASLSVTTAYDEFSRATSVASSLGYTPPTPGVTVPQGNMNVLMDYNDAGQLTLRRLMSAEQGFYGENIAYDHARGWLTSINSPNPRSFDAKLCEEPQGDVYAPETSTEPATLSDIFANLAQGNPVAIPEIDCIYEYDPPTEGCIRNTDIDTYTIKIPNPKKESTGSFANAAQVPCPYGSNCSSLSRKDNLKDVHDIMITGIGVRDSNGIVSVLPLSNNYSLNAMLLSSQTQGVDSSETSRLRIDIFNQANAEGWYIQDLKFQVKSDATNCTKCSAGGAKNYALDIEFINSERSIEFVKTEYEYSTHSAPTINETYEWERYTTKGLGFTAVAVPCTIPIPDGKPKEQGKSLNSNPVQESITWDEWYAEQMKLPAQDWLVNGNQRLAASPVVIPVLHSRVKLSSDQIPSQDSTMILNVVNSVCPRDEETLQGSNTNARSQASGPQAEVLPQFTMTREVVMHKLQLRNKSTTLLIDLAEGGLPYTFSQGKISEVDQQTNLSEARRIETKVNQWFRDNANTKNWAEVTFDSLGNFQLNLHSDDLELLTADYSTSYAITVTCPDGSTESVRIVSDDNHVINALLLHRSIQSHRNIDALDYRKPKGVANPNNNNPFGAKQPVTQKSGGIKICDPQDPPSCTPQETAQQLDQVNQFYEDTDSTYLANLTYPTVLYSVVLCDGSTAYLLADQLNQLIGDHNITGQMPITSSDQLINATLPKGPNQLFALELEYEKNGNIKQADWKTTYHAPKRYEYTYDALNRITSANYSQQAIGNNDTADDIFSVDNIEAV